MYENDEPAVALPLIDPEVENQNQENQQDLPLSNHSLQDDPTVQVNKGNIALNDQSDVATKIQYLAWCKICQVCIFTKQE